MTSCEILAELPRYGVTLRLGDDSRLKVRWRGKDPPAGALPLLKEIKARKAELVAYLSHQKVPTEPYGPAMGAAEGDGIPQANLTRIWSGFTRTLQGVLAYQIRPGIIATLYPTRPECLEDVYCKRLPDCALFLLTTQSGMTGFCRERV